MNHYSVLHVSRYLDEASDSMLVDISFACQVSNRSRASMYRHIKAGDLTSVKVGHSRRIRVGDLRKLIGAK